MLGALQGDYIKVANSATQSSSLFTVKALLCTNLYEAKRVLSQFNFFKLIRNSYYRKVKAVNYFNTTQHIVQYTITVLISLVCSRTTSYTLSRMSFMLSKLLLPAKSDFTSFWWNAKHIIYRVFSFHIDTWKLFQLLCFPSEASLSDWENHLPSMVLGKENLMGVHHNISNKT